VPYNLYSEVFKPMPFAAKFRFFQLKNDGFGLLWASPVFFLVFPAAKYFWKGINSLQEKKGNPEGPFNSADLLAMAGAAISCIGIAAVIFMMVGNGWVQFAARYTLDFQVLLLVFAVFLVKVWRGGKFYLIALALLLISIYVQYFGAKYFS